MKQNRSSWAVLGVSALLMAAPVLSEAARITLRRDTVLPVVFNERLTIKENRSGDRFSARLDDNRDFPRGTTLNGRVVSVRQAREGQPAYMDLEFTEMLLPNGNRVRLRAVPIPLNDKYVERDRDGRIRARKNVVRQEQAVIGGALGGLVIGSLIKKPVEGALLGTLAGVILAQTGATTDNNTVVSKDQKMGALIERDVTIDTYGDDRYGRDDRDDRYGRRDDRYDRDDRYGRNDRNDRNDRPRSEDGQWERDDRYRDDIAIRTGSRELRFSQRERPYRLGDTVMVPIQRTADQLGLNVERVRNSGVIYIDGDDFAVKLAQDSREYRVNGRRATLDRAVVERDGVLYAPIEVFAEIKRESLYVNGNKISARTY
jgi:hypothetical protein